MNVLLVYASTHGHTGHIAQRIARVVREHGHHVSIRRVDQAPDDLGHWDAVIVGGSLHYTTHQPELVAWVHEHRHALASRPSAFFSVSLSAADDTPKARAATRECIDRFVEDTEWDPDHSVALAGSLQYTRYDLPTRIVMQAMMHREGRPTDTSRDHEMTNWRVVDAFARQAAHHFEHALAAA